MPSPADRHAPRRIPSARRCLAAALLALGITARDAMAQRAAASVVIGAARDGDPTRPLGHWRVAGQVASGLALGPVGFVAGGLTTRWVARRFGAGDDRAATLGYAGGWTGAVLGTAAGPALVGARGPGAGSYPAAIGGAAAGGLLSWGIVRLNKKIVGEREPRPCRVVCVVSTVAIATLPSIGATVAYDASRR